MELEKILGSQGESKNENEINIGNGTIIMRGKILNDSGYLPQFRNILSDKTDLDKNDDSEMKYLLGKKGDEENVTKINIGDRCFIYRTDLSSLARYNPRYENRT